MIAIALIAGLQARPQSVFPSTGKLQISIMGDPLITAPLSVTCDGNHGGQRQVQNINRLVVNISSIQVHRTGALNLTGDWITIDDAPKSIDILNLNSISQLHSSTSLPDGVINLARLTVSPTAIATIGTNSKNVIVSSDHLDAQTNAQVTSGKVTSITLELVQPHVVCLGNGDLRLTPQLTATSETMD